MRPALVIITAYLLGSIPFGYLIVKAKQGADIRQTGSGGTGATNVSRRAGKSAGAITLILDALKGAAAVSIARLALGLPPFMEGGQGSPPLDRSAQWWVAAAALAVIFGHIFPFWLRFRGGKGVATGVGVFLVLAPLAVVLAALIFGVIVWMTRYVSLGSLAGAAAIPLFVWLQSVFIQPVANAAPLMTAAIGGALLIIYAHRTNIGRLMQGTESKFH